MMLYDSILLYCSVFLSSDVTILLSCKAQLLVTQLYIILPLNEKVEIMLQLFGEKHFNLISIFIDYILNILTFEQWGNEQRL